MDGLTIATLALVAVTLLLVVVGVGQIFLIRSENKLERSQCMLAIRSDAVLENCVRRLERQLTPVC